MSEITKLYENAGVKSFKTCEFCTQRSVDCLKENISNITCGFASDIYPPFTAEKQLKIVKQILFSTWWMNLKRLQFSEKFDEGLAQMINELWQDLSEEEKQQVKGILE